MFSSDFSYCTSTATPSLKWSIVTVTCDGMCLGLESFLSRGLPPQLAMLLSGLYQS